MIGSYPAQIRYTGDISWSGHQRTLGGHQKHAEWIVFGNNCVGRIGARGERARKTHGRTDRAISSLPRLVRALLGRRGEEGVQCSARTETAEATTTTTTATRMMKLLGGGRSSRANDDDDDNGCRL